MYSKKDAGFRRHPINFKFCPSGSGANLFGDHFCKVIHCTNELTNITHFVIVP